ncbi:hypothetical protein D3C75_317760 [compost metagenome]
MQNLLLKRGYGRYILGMDMMPDTPLQRRQRIVSEIISVQAVHTAEQKFNFDLLQLLPASRIPRLFIISPFHRCHRYRCSLACFRISGLVIFTYCNAITPIIGLRIQPYTH